MCSVYYAEYSVKRRRKITERLIMVDFVILSVRICFERKETVISNVLNPYRTSDRYEFKKDSLFRILYYILFYIL